MSRIGFLAMAGVAAVLASVASSAWAEKKYDTGASDKEVRIGHLTAYSGPASAYGIIGRALDAYFNKINAEGGINGRKIKFISLDDAYSPPKTVEQARKLVEEEEVFALFNPLGTATNNAIVKYMNQKKIPHVFLATGASRWGDYKNFPWTMGWQPTYLAEGRVYAEYLLEQKPNAKIAILMQNDDYGRDYVRGFKEGLGDKAATMIVKELTYEVTDATIDSQMVSLKSSGADTFFNVTTPKFAAMAIKKAAELGWKPLHLLNNVSASVGSVLVPAGLDNSVGVVTAVYGKDPTDPQWADTPEFKDWLEFMKKYYPSGDLKDASNVYGYSVGQTLVQVLKQCGDNLTRENFMKQAANLNFQLPMMLPGVLIKTGPDDYYPIEQEQLARFDGKTWARFGRVYGRQ